MLLRSAIAASVLALPASALAERMTTREALDRLEETLTIRVQDNAFDTDAMVPAIIVSVRPAFEETTTWYPTAATASLLRVFGSAAMRLCEACMAPRTFVEEGRLEQSSSEVSVPEIIRLDEGLRGSAAPARTAIWLDETAQGVSLRIIDLRNGRILVAENVDPSLSEMARTKEMLSLSRELDRRARGDSITQAFFDAILYPKQHVSMDWTDQWGDTNANLSGVSLSFFDPVVGVGGVYYRIVPEAANIAVGGKILLSVPTALVRGVSGEDIDVIDNLLTAVFVMRIPFGRSNYSLSFSLSTNGRLGVGFSLLNMSLLPVLP